MGSVLVCSFKSQEWAAECRDIPCTQLHLMIYTSRMIIFVTFSRWENMEEVKANSLFLIVLLRTWARMLTSMTASRVMMLAPALRYLTYRPTPMFPWARLSSATVCTGSAWEENTELTHGQNIVITLHSFRNYTTHLKNWEHILKRWPFPFGSLNQVFSQRKHEKNDLIFNKNFNSRVESKTVNCSNFKEKSNRESKHSTEDQCAKLNLAQTLIV